MSDANQYYRDYYATLGAAAYLGEKMKQSSRMLVFQEWLRAELKPGAKVLDVGCGDAIFAELMPEFEWYGVDINTDRAVPRYATVKEVDRLVTHDLMAPPYPWPAGQFDAIISSEVLEHLWDLRVVHKEVRRLLKRDGLYVISTPNFDWVANQLEGHKRLMQQDGQSWTWEHIRHYGYDNHKAFLNACGFVIEKHAGADAHYCPIFSTACAGIQEGLGKMGIEVSAEILHKMAGEKMIMMPDGRPLNMQHTIILSARKA